MFSDDDFFFFLLNVAENSFMLFSVENLDIFPFEYFLYNSGTAGKISKTDWAL